MPSNTTRATRAILEEELLAVSVSVVLSACAVLLDEDRVMAFQASVMEPCDDVDDDVAFVAALPSLSS